VSAVEEFRQGEFQLNGSSKQLTGLNPATLADVLAIKVTSGSFSRLSTGGVAVFAPVRVQPRAELSVLRRAGLADRTGRR